MKNTILILLLSVTIICCKKKTDDPAPVTPAAPSPVNVTLEVCVSSSLNAIMSSNAADYEFNAYADSVSMAGTDVAGCYMNYVSVVDATPCSTPLCTSPGGIIPAFNSGSPGGNYRYFIIYNQLTSSYLTNHKGAVIVDASGNITSTGDIQIVSCGSNKYKVIL